jgi:Protein of unknown function (DUF1257)
MSQTYVCKSQISDVKILRDSLADIGIAADAIVQTETQQELHGYHGKQMVDILIKKESIKTSHDIGFRKNAEGMYDILVYDADVRRGIGSKVTPTVMGGTGELMQHYAKHTILKTARLKHGHRAHATVKDGRIKIKVEVS